MKSKLVSMALLVAALLLLGVMTAPAISAQIEAISNGNGLWLSQSTFGTATPQLLVNNNSAGNSLEIRASNTPVFSINSSGEISGQTLSYFTAGDEIYCGTDVITGTKEVITSLADPDYAFCSLSTVTGDAVGCSTAVTDTVIIKVWNSAATPAANAAGATVHWCAIGTP